MDDAKGFLSTMNAVIEAAASDQKSNPTAVRPAMNAAEFEKVVSSRRSVRVFTGAPVDEKTVRKILEMAMLAPSSSNLQPWEFHWVRSPAKKQKLIEACLSQPAAQTAGELMVIVARTKTWKRNTAEMLRIFAQSKAPVPAAVLSYYKKLVPMAMNTGPLGVAALIKFIVTRIARYKQPIPQGPIGKNDLRVWAHKSVALAAENFMLACRAFNLDSCPMEGFDGWRVKKLIGLPSDAEVNMIIAFGVAKPEGIYGERIRFDNKFFVFEH